MRTGNRFAIAAVVVLAFAAIGCDEVNTTLSIRSDGSCEMTTAMDVKRATLEPQLRMMAQMNDMDVGDEPEAAAEPAPMTDDELAEAVKSMFEERMAGQGGVQTEVEKVEVKGEMIHIATKRSFESLKGMLSQPGVMAEIGFSRMVFAKDDDGHLSVTLHATGMTPERSKMMKTQIKLQGMKARYELVLPGKILSSDLPEMKERATWLAIDAKKNETLDAMVKIYEAGKVVVTSELGGLTLDEELDSQKLAVPFGMPRGRGEPDVPVVDAGPGFLAEAESITTTSLYYFPSAPENYAKNDHEGREAGIKISAKLFAPRGRRLLSIASVKAISAVDDQGRKVKTQSETPESYAMSHSSMNDDEENASVDMQLQLALPEPGAEAIEELDGEAIVTTFAGWNEHRIDTVVPDENTEIALDDILPGAKIAVLKTTDQSKRDRAKQRNGTLRIRLSGPKEISQISIKVFIAGVENVNSYDSGFGGPTASTGTREMNISYNAYDFEGGSLEGTPGVTIRMPKELRKERVKFKLEGLDLF